MMSLKSFHYHDPMNTKRNALQPHSGLHFLKSRALTVGVLAILGASMLGCATAQTTDLKANAGSPAIETPSPTNSALTAPLFYQLLLGELNLSVGDPGLGFNLLLNAARKQHDPDLYQRAVDAALQNRSGDAALEAARAWSKDLPKDVRAERYVLQILLALNRPGETAGVLKAIVEHANPSDRLNTINAIPQTYAKVPDKALALAVVKEALANALKQPDQAAAAWTTVGRMELAQGQALLALSSARKGHAADPGSPFPAMLALELFERGEADAESLVLAHQHASSLESEAEPAVALSYSRVLLDMQRYADARTQLNALTARRPEIAEPWLLLATLQVQGNALAPATESLKKYMALARQSDDERVSRGLTQAYLLMAQIAEKQKDYPAANAWLDRIENADDVLLAQMRRASLLARQGKLPEARALLQNQPERRPGDARLKLVVEAQLLRDFKAYDAAYDVYGTAVKQFPEDQELLYEQAMMAEKADRLDDMERLLRQLIAAHPDHHHAYNALGYSFADRNLRLPEAKQLIEKAVELQPTDAFIQDSLAWVEFRLGNAPRALELLRAAYKKRPDPEIAAHLGEVLWNQGQKDAALKIWREGLLVASDNETLLSTLKRLQVKP
jgi:tetratricopeptide (TPR) repeat protein